MKYLFTSALLVVGILFFTGCNDNTLSSNDMDSYIQEFNSEAEMRAPAPGNQTIAEIVVESASADEAEFTLLLAALEYTGLNGVFTGSDQYTVFAPTDDAFLALVDALSEDLDPDVVENGGPFAAIDDLLGEGTVANVLLYHVTEGRRAANSVVPKNMRAKDRKVSTLLEDANFSVAFGGTITDIAGQEASITAADVSASNGIIHVIDTVLLPLE